MEQSANWIQKKNQIYMCSHEWYWNCITKTYSKLFLTSNSQDDIEDEENM